MVESDAVGRLARRYDEQAVSYGELWAPALRPSGRQLVGVLGLERESTILDLGTGTGALLPDIRAVAPSALVVGVDRSEGMVAKVSKDYPVAVMDGRALGFRDGSFDAVLMVFLLFHFPEPPRALMEAGRVLRPGGRLGVLTWGEDRPSVAMRIWTEELDAHGAEPADPTTGLALHELVDTPDKMTTLLKGAGLANIRAWTEEWSFSQEPEALLRRLKTMGLNKTRFESLDEKARASVQEVVRGRWRSLDPTDYMQSGLVVYSLGEAA